MIMHRTNKILFFLWLLSIVVLQACDKQNDWLEQKQNKGGVMPSTLKEVQAILDDHASMNGQYSPAGNVGADNNFVTDDNLNTQNPSSIGMYLWAKDVYQGASSSDWNSPY